MPEPTSLLCMQLRARAHAAVKEQDIEGARAVLGELGVERDLLRKVAQYKGVVNAENVYNVLYNAGGRLSMEKVRILLSMESLLVTLVEPT